MPTDKKLEIADLILSVLKKKSYNIGKNLLSAILV